MRENAEEARGGRVEGIEKKSGMEKKRRGGSVGGTEEARGGMREK